MYDDECGGERRRRGERASVAASYYMLWVFGMIFMKDFVELYGDV